MRRRCFPRRCFPHTRRRCTHACVRFSTRRARTRCAAFDTACRQKTPGSSGRYTIPGRKPRPGWPARVNNRYATFDHTRTSISVRCCTRVCWARRKGRFYMSIFDFHARERMPVARVALIVVLALICTSSAKAESPKLAQMQTPGGTEFGILGGKPASPAPVLFLFAADLERTLTDPAYNRVATLLGEQGFVCVSL